MDVEFTQLSDLGRVRQGNEDYFGHAAPATPERVRSHGWLFVLADGVGGHDLGEVASHTAVESVLAGFRDAPAGETHTALCLARSMQTANRQVIDAGHASGSARHLDGDHASWLARCDTTVPPSPMWATRAAI